MHLVQNCRMEVQTEWWVDHSFIFISEVDFLCYHFIYFWFTDRNDNKRRSGYWIGRILSHWGQSANCRSLDCFWPGWVKENIIISSIYLKKKIRNKFFIESPGRDLGGFLSFVQGFRLRAWLASVVFLITMPLVFFIIYKILFFFELQEVTEWTVGWNLFAVAGAIVQQVFHSWINI